MEKNNIDDDLFDAILKVAAEESLRQEVEEMQSCAEANEQYKPSPALSKKIRKIIARYSFNQGSILWKKTILKVSVSAAVFVLVSSVILFSVDATRNYILNAVIKWHEDYFSIEYEENKNNISDIYFFRPTYLPENFIEISSNAVGGIVRVIYKNENGMEIHFQQSPSQSSHLLVDREDKTYTATKINGYEAHIFIATQDDKNNTLLWESNGVIFIITSEIDIAELVLMAESIKNNF